MIYGAKMGKIYSIDIDGTLTKDTAWDAEGCLNAEPRTEAIKRVNELSLKNFIIIHTARRHELYLPTIEWLNKNNVRFHAVSFGKMPCDQIYDEDAINDWRKL